MGRPVKSGCKSKGWLFFAVQLFLICLFYFLLSLHGLSFWDLDWRSIQDSSKLMVDLSKDGAGNSVLDFVADNKDASNSLLNSSTKDNRDGSSDIKGISLQTDLSSGLSQNDLDIELKQTADVKDASFRSEDVLQLTDLSKDLQKRNRLPPKHRDLFPTLSADHVVIVLYVHNRPQYLRMVVDGLSKVKGINETLLIVSHDGFYEEMNEIIENISFCQVKQIFAPFSPHLFTDSFPGVAPQDCQGKDGSTVKGCKGNPDQYGNHRSPRIVSLKHHWWWMMNTVWDGLKETSDYDRHIVFIEEDHYLYPNAYRNIQKLIMLKGTNKCPECWAANLAPWDVKSRGEEGDFLVAEKMGNVGYSFNRTVWRKIHAKTNSFCSFDDYNWDITLWASVFPTFSSAVYTLRAPRTSAFHFGKCGLHQGKKDGQATCLDSTRGTPEVDRRDKTMNIKNEWNVVKYSLGGIYSAGFKGWGGWGDERDRHLCLAFSNMYLA